MNEILEFTVRLLVLLFAATVAPVSADSNALERGSFELDGRSLSYFCTGIGSPTLILEAPSGVSNAEAYANVLGELAQRARVCAYERAFYGDSDPLEPGEVQDVADYSDELGRFLALENVPEPFVLIGFSYGGFVSRYFAGHHPEDIVGMVLIDSPHVDWLRLMKQQLTKEDWAKVQDILDWFIENRGHDAWASQFLVEDAPALPSDLPIAIIVRDRDHDRMRLSGISEAGFRIYNDVHFQLSPELAGLSDRTTTYAASDSDHMIPDNDPEIVLRAVDELLGIVRASEL